jgi:hypothetical protein
LNTVDAYAQNDPQRGKILLAGLIELHRRGLPAGLEVYGGLGALRQPPQR